jgi:hypothetical protein
VFSIALQQPALTVGAAAPQDSTFPQQAALSQVGALPMHLACAASCDRSDAEQALPLRAASQLEVSIPPSPKLKQLLLAEIALQRSGLPHALATMNISSRGARCIPSPLAQNARL